jgi:GDP-L-fucose synthase
MGRLVVTGGNGLLGSALRRMNHPDTTFLTRDEVDLTDFNAVRAAFKLLKPERVIHTAAVVGGLGGNMIHSGEYFRNNIMMNTNVLEAARQAGVKKLISFMSTCVFPDKSDYPLKAEQLHGGPPHPSNFGYAYAKRMLEVQSSAYRKEWNCNYIVAIPANMYGPNDNFSLTEGHVVPSLIHKVYLAARNGEDLVVWGSGKPLREFLLVDDIARLSLWALDGYDEELPLILSSGIETSIAELVACITRLMKFNGRIIFDSDKPDGQFRKPSDAEQLRRYLPDFSFTPVEEGIRQTIEWFLAHYPDVRQ